MQRTPKWVAKVYKASMAELICPADALSKFKQNGDKERGHGNARHQWITSGGRIDAGKYTSACTALVKSTTASSTTRKTNELSHAQDALRNVLVAHGAMSKEEYNDMLLTQTAPEKTADFLKGTFTVSTRCGVCCDQYCTATYIRMFKMGMLCV